MSARQKQISSAATPGIFGRLIASESAAGLVLMAAAALALAVANSPLSHAYFGVLGAHAAGLSILHWINDGLMAVFFLLVGMEIKQEFIGGELSTWPKRILPGICALGGMVVPALVYLLLNGGSPAASRGWAIPTATDIAFALGVLSLLGSRVPPSLKVFLAALAIIDDLGAVLIIALFYTASLNAYALGGVAVIICALIALGRFGISRLAPYLLLGALLWVLMLLSGVHATLAGVILALALPVTGAKGNASPLHALEHAISPWVAFVVVPVFGFANAGVSFSGFDIGVLLHPVPLGVALGLFLGKQVGVFGMVLLAARLGWATLPDGASMRHAYGVSLLCGIGFTMSLFIGLLAFPGAAALQDEVKVGVFLGSLLSGLAGALVLCVRPEKLTD